eukprot:355896-Chlamydomonas_euryale.AAC.3
MSFSVVATVAPSSWMLLSTTPGNARRGATHAHTEAAPVPPTCCSARGSQHRRQSAGGETCSAAVGTRNATRIDPRASTVPSCSTASITAGCSTCAVLPTPGAPAAGRATAATLHPSGAVRRTLRPVTAALWCGSGPRPAARSSA